MTTTQNGSRAKRWIASSIAATFLLQSLTPAFAQQVPSQVPGIFLPPPASNVMFTLDDSGSMQADVIPDFSLEGVSYEGRPTENNNNSRYNGINAYPNMWGSSSTYLTRAFYGYGSANQNALSRYMRSSAGNPLYYDPKVTYLPWPDPNNDTGRLAPANPRAVRIHPTIPYSTSGSRLLDLTAQQESGNQRYWYATYYVYTGTTPLPLATPHTSLNTASAFTKYEITNDASQRFPRASTRTDCSGAVLPATTGCTQAEELQNFANWLQYYRSRMLMAKGGVAAAFAAQGTNLRVGFAAINYQDANPNNAVVRRVAPFSGISRTAFYNALYDRPVSTYTQLRRALDDVGRYFSGSIPSLGNPWSEDANSAPTRADSCRKSFHILSTDGFWNQDPGAATAAARQNNDQFAASERTPDRPNEGPGSGYPYTDTGAPGTLAARFTINPFRDSATNTLADVAAYYWKTDLQTGLANQVAPSSRDPAYWQHLTTYTVGLGISGSGQVRPAAAALSVRNAANEWVVASNLPATSPFVAHAGKPWLSDPVLRDLLVAHRTPMSWPASITENTPATGDDLVHAAMNGRGRYYSANDPQSLASGLAAALAEASNQDASLANLSISVSSEAADGNQLFQAVYNPAGWYGRLYAFPMNSGGSVVNEYAAATWEASRVLPSPENRNIFTWNPAAATPRGSVFTWDGLNAAQRTALGPAAGAGSTEAERRRIVDYIRGVIADEVQSGGPLRDRVRETNGGALGDIVGGSPLKGSGFGGGYHRMRTSAPGQDSYAQFRPISPEDSPLRNMISSVYFGANDGMLHAVNSETGVERFAFVPNAVFSVPRTQYAGTNRTVSKLYEMSRPDYSHLFTVNGPPQLSDAYISIPGERAAWRALLMGSTGAGARNVFAMDVTNPVAGNGADQFNANKILWEFSESEDADMGHVASYPHVAKMQDGTWVAMFGNGFDSASGRAVLYLLDLETGAVVWKQAVSTVAGNGLSQPNFLLNRYREVTAIYAGDLRGNMWKFDVNSPNRADWQVAFSGAPLFTTRASQPITVMPDIEEFPAGSGNAMVLFGTGKQFDEQDMSPSPAVNVNLSQQSIYGIWDNGPTRVTNVSQLMQRAFTDARPGYERTTTDDPDIDWATRRGWELPLPRTGERVNVNPFVMGRGLPALFVANTPSNVACESGGQARILMLDPITGLAPRVSPFDTNDDGRIDSSDGRFNVLTVLAGVVSQPKLLRGAANSSFGQEAPGTRGRTGTLDGGVEFGGSSNSPCTDGATGRILAGISNVDIVNQRVRLAECTGRVSWRQLQ